MGYVLDLKGKASQAEFGALVGISQPAVSGLVTRGVVTEGGTVGEWLMAYCGHLREHAARWGSSGSLNLANERARLAAEQADKIALQNRVARHEFAPVSVIEESLASVGRQIAGIMEAIPVKLKRSTDMTAEQLEQVERDLAEARNLAAVVKPDWSQIDVPSAD